MNFTPAAITAAAHKNIAKKVMTGGERVLYISNAPSKRIGEMFLSSNASGTYVADPVWGGSDLSANPSDLQVVSVDGFKSNAAVVFSLSGTGADSSPLLGSGIFSPPSWVRNQTYDFSKGMAVDITPNRVGVKFKVINAPSVAVTNAELGATFRILALPDTNTWVEIDKIESVGVNYGTKPAVHIPEGLEGTDEITTGRSSPQTLSVQGFNRGVADGIQRYAGQSCCLRVDVFAQGKILKERQFYGNALLEVNPGYGSGGDLSTQAAEGGFEDLACFPAP